MNCTEASALQSDLFDGELSAEVQASVVEHISSCERCTAEYRKFVRTVRFVRANTGAPALHGAQGARYEEFMRSIVDEGYEKDPVRVLMEQAGEGGKS
jgi:anti-sigma factor RsiW